jgi:hypothetical protein
MSARIFFISWALTLLTLLENSRENYNKRSIGGKSLLGILLKYILHYNGFNGFSLFWTTMPISFLVKTELIQINLL